jgi:hypothetical protein
MPLATAAALTLAEVQALRPPASDAASIRAAIARAEAAQDAALDRAEAIERHMAAALLTASDEAMEVAEREASLAKRGADRLGALLEELRISLAAAEGRDALAVLMTESTARNVAHRSHAP